MMWLNNRLFGVVLANVITSTEFKTKNKIMDRETIEKANRLNDRIDNLETLQRDLRPKHCSGVAFGKIATGNGYTGVDKYEHHLWSVTPKGKEDNSTIEKVAIVAMYNEVCKLLIMAKDELRVLK